MRTKIQTSSLVVLLFLIFSCSKENTGSSADSSNRNGVASASVSSNTFEQSMDEQTDQSIVGKWIKYYDWDCDGDPGSTFLTINSNGTWSSDEGYTGLWITGRHMLTFIYDGSETTYSGVMFISQIKGIMSTFQYAQSRQGCFHMAPYKGTNKQQHKAGILDANGKRK
jgi:hypothetical protein